MAYPPLKADQSEIVQLTTRIMELENRIAAIANSELRIADLEQYRKAVNVVLHNIDESLRSLEDKVSE